MMNRLIQIVGNSSRGGGEETWQHFPSFHHGTTQHRHPALAHALRPSLSATFMLVSLQFFQQQVYSRSSFILLCDFRHFQAEVFKISAPSRVHLIQLVGAYAFSVEKGGGMSRQRYFS